MNMLVCKSWLLLVYLDVLLRFRSFRYLYDLVRQRALNPRSFGRPPRLEDLVHAVDLACVFYFKQVQCLQRSAVATLLLRGYGYPARLVIGAQILPFYSHAWVECPVGVVVNDKPSVRTRYSELSSC